MTLSGCSTIKVVYNNSDDLIYWWLDGYADLQGEQKQFTRDALTDLQRWHRQQQLPEYVTLLQRMQTMALNDITPAQVCAVTEDMKNSMVRVLNHMEPASAQLSNQLSADQLRSVRKRFDKTNKTWKEDWLDPNAEERLRYRTKQATHRLEDFYGRLDKPQRDALQGLNGVSLSAFAQDSNAPNKQEQAQSLLRGLVDRSFNSPNERYRAYNRELWNENCAGFAKLHNSTTPAQRQRMLEALRGYAQDFKTLMAQK
jgi:hypothetical protein